MHAALVSRHGAVVAITSALALSLAAVRSTNAHGSASKPISRIYSGFLEGPEHPQSAAVAAAIAVGGTQPFYDWNEIVNFFPGSPQQQMNIQYSEGIPDGEIASGGNPKYAGLDLVRDDWPATPISSGAYEIIFHTTTPHDPSVFHAWITSADWNPLQPLNWGQLEALQIGAVTTVGTDYHFSTILPARTGKHCIYVIWQRLDPVGEGFYSISDVDFDAGEGPMCPADFNASGGVDGADLGVLLASWNSAGADLDGDGVTNGADLGVLLASWGSCGPDCNGNGISDTAEIIAGAPDCNGNGIPDACDIAQGGDANGDGFLDACQLDGLTFSWSVPTQWQGGFIGSLTIHNGSNSMIHGWTLVFDAPSYLITSLWDGVLLSQSSGVATVANETWNGHLPAGASVTIGFTANGTPIAPSTVIMNQSPVIPGG